MRSSAHKEPDANSGTGLIDRVEQAGRSGGRALVLNLASGLGWVRVERAGQEEF